MRKKGQKKKKKEMGIEMTFISIGLLLIFIGLILDQNDTLLKYSTLSLGICLSVMGLSNLGLKGIIKSSSKEEKMYVSYKKKE
ncbi:hypothetical protein, partial [Xanthovirga aplysinae]|uniref:hypothetical protein n=1 Tax=Xanthovirga aplysinae TaxID=2529853 RepID=UPI0012BCAF9B